MANTPQAKKRIRRNTARTIVNKNRVSRIRTLVKKVEAAVAAGDKDAAAAALKAAQPEMARGVAKGVLYKNTVARKYSRLNKSIHATACLAHRRSSELRDPPDSVRAGLFYCLDNMQLLQRGQCRILIGSFLHISIVTSNCSKRHTSEV